MTRAFCTLFDKNYLYQGVALYNSLRRHAADFRLYALCMDSIAFDLLSKWAPGPSLVPLSVSDLLTPEVASVRARTSHGQFCWVCQPLVCEYVLDRFDEDMVTYLEADSIFFSDPEPLFAELGARSVSLVPHNFAVGLDNTETAGRFCVQFNAFRSDVRARRVLADWKAACFQYDASAPTSYPGQTCLDQWPRFEGVGIIEHRGAGVAPWNVNAYKLDAQGGVPYVDGVPVVFYHYHQYGRYRSGAHELGSYPLSKAVIDAFYRPYVNAIASAEADVKAVDSAFVYRRQYDNNKSFLDVVRSPTSANATNFLTSLKRRLRRRYNVFPASYFEADSRVERT